MLVLRRSNFRGATFSRQFRDIDTLLSSLFTTKFSSARQFKNHIELFSTSSDKSCDSKMYNLRKKTQKPTKYNFNCIFAISPLVYRKFSRTTTIHPGIFRRRALWAESVSPRMNIIASRDQFKPKRARQDLVVNSKQKFLR